MKNVAVFGIYATRDDAEGAVASLQLAGFRNTDISALFPNNVGTKDFAHEMHTKAPEGTAAGAASGAVLGGLLGWLAGAGALIVPGIGPLLAAGPILGMLAGMGAVGVVGGLVGALVGMGIPEYEAKRYEGRIKSGGILLSVHCDAAEWIARAKDVLKHTGAEDIAAASEAGADYLKTDKPMPRAHVVDERPAVATRVADTPEVAQVRATGPGGTGYDI